MEVAILVGGRRPGGIPGAAVARGRGGSYSMYIRGGLEVDGFLFVELWYQLTGSGAEENAAF